MSITPIEEVLQLIKERFQVIKEGDTCPVSGEIFDVTVDAITTNTTEWVQMEKNQRCSLFIDFEDIRFSEIMPQKSLQSYNVCVTVKYVRSTRTASDDEYDRYLRHLPIWLNMMLADETTTINNLWQKIYYKPNMGKGLNNMWKVETTSRGGSFMGYFLIAGVTVRSDYRQMFITEE